MLGAGLNGGIGLRQGQAVRQSGAGHEAIGEQHYAADSYMEMVQVYGMAVADTYSSDIEPTYYGYSSVSNLDHVAIPASMLDNVRMCKTSAGSTRRLQHMKTKRLCDHCAIEIHMRHEIHLRKHDEGDRQPDRDLLMNALCQGEEGQKFHDALWQEVEK